MPSPHLHVPEVRKDPEEVERRGVAPRTAVDPLRLPQQQLPRRAPVVWRLPRPEAQPQVVTTLGGEHHVCGGEVPGCGRHLLVVEPDREVPPVGRAHVAERVCGGGKVPQLILHGLVCVVPGYQWQLYGRGWHHFPAPGGRERVVHTEDAAEVPLGVGVRKALAHEGVCRVQPSQFVRGVDEDQLPPPLGIRPHACRPKILPHQQLVGLPFNLLRVVRRRGGRLGVGDP
mmetsp:Transcript_3075/g.7813  ORF Transcript_3075/g.7813 Transcript_3075/m.7813 type:complete len:229 (-) Transcript_3075:117-803(-)